VVNLLLDKGADIEIANADGVTPIISAAENGHADVMRLLIERGANINARTLSDSTALIKASAANQIEVVDTLLRFGADVTALDKWGQSAFDVAAEKGHAAVVSMLKLVVVVYGDPQMIIIQQQSLTAAGVMTLQQPAVVQPIHLQDASMQGAVPSENWYQEPIIQVRQ